MRHFVIRYYCSDNAFGLMSVAELIADFDRTFRTHNDLDALGCSDDLLHYAWSFGFPDFVIPGELLLHGLAHIACQDVFLSQPAWSQLQNQRIPGIDFSAYFDHSVVIQILELRCLVFPGIQ